MNKKSLILAIFLILVVFLGSSAVFAEDTSDIQSATADEVEVQQNYIDDMQASSTFNIKAGASNDEIQNTINGMKDGDVLNFEKGTYTDVCLYINKSITVNGNGANLIGFDNASKDNVPSIITNTSAQGGYGIGNVATLYIVKANDVAINGLTVTAGANSSSRDTNPAYSNALVYVESSNNLDFKNNILDGSSWGLYLRFSNDCQIVENTIKNQAVTGILSFGSARTQIEKNTVIDAKNHGIDVRHGTGPNVQVINNSVSGSQEGIYLMHSKGHTAAYNTIENCTISSISCYGSSDIDIHDNIMKKSRIGLLLGGGYSNIKVGNNTFALDNLPFPPTFVYNVAEAKSDFGTAQKMIGTHSDGADSEFPYYTEYTGTPTPKEINVDYDVILNPTGTTYTVPQSATSAQIQTMIASMSDGDTLSFAENAVYNDISIYTDKNIKILGNNATLIGYDNLDLANCPTKVTATTADDGYAISERAVLYVLNNTNAVVSNLNIIAQFPGYDPNTVVGAMTMEYKTAGIRLKNAVNVTVTGCAIDGASWGIYMEYSHNAIVTNNDIKNQFTTGILNFGTGYSILANNTITDAVNHGIDVRHGTGPSVTVFNNTISGSKEGIYLMHSKGHNVYNNTITNGVISGITCYGSGSENIFDNSISGSRLGILLGGGYYNVTIGPNTYDLDALPFPPTFVSYLVKVESKRQTTTDKVYSDKNTVTIEPSTFVTPAGEFNYTIALTDDSGFAVQNQEIEVSANNETYTVKTNAKGTATIALNLAEGEYPVSVDYAGTDNYKAAAAEQNIIVASVVKPADNTAKSIQEAVDAAKPGDIVDLTVFDNYDVENATIEVSTENITILGDGSTVIKGWGGPGNGIFCVKAPGVTVKGINFIDTNPDSVLTYYDDPTKNANQVSGWGIHFQRTSDGVVDNCSFIDFNHGVRIQGSNNVTVKNSYFTGVTNYLRNDPTVNVEKGTKAVGIMGSQGAKIIDNVFDGPMLDAVSIASNCGGAVVTGNTFIDNAYSIYFGGASTGGTLISNNTFSNCGVFDGVDNNNQSVFWDALPVISIQKSAAGLEITDNTFKAINNNILIAAEAGNAAHGYPSEIGNINVTGNQVTSYGSLPEEYVASSITLLHILSRGGDLNPTGPIDVTGNTFLGAVKAVVYWNTAWGNETGQISDVYIPKGSLAPTTISITELAKDGTVTAVLKDVNANPVAGAEITYTAGDLIGTVETDENGAFSISAPLGTPIEINFAETSKLAASSANITVPAFEQIDTDVSAEQDVIRYANDYKAGERGSMAYGILKDADGNPIANAPCYVAINGYNYGPGERTPEEGNITYTDADGKFGLYVNMASAGSYTYALVYLGNDTYKASFNSTRVVLNKKPVTLTASAQSFRASAATKKISVTMKTNVKSERDGKVYLSGGKTVTLKLNGVTYTAKTNANGVATFNVRLNTRGTYAATFSFAGDSTYSAASGRTTVRIT